MKPFVAALLVLGFIYVHCTTDKSLPSGFENLDRANRGDVSTARFPLSDFAVYRGTLPAGSTTTLLLGEYKNTRSYVAVMFQVSSSITSATVESAELTLPKSFHYGEGDSFLVSAYRIEKEWDETTVLWSDLEAGYDQSNIVGSFRMNSIDSIDNKLAISPELVNDWIDNSDTNYGLLLKFDQATFMNKLLSSEYTLGGGSLSVAYETTSGDLDTVTVNVASDASLIEYDSNVGESVIVKETDVLRVGNASGFNTLLKFDIANLPANANIHRAFIYLDIDSTNSETPEELMTANTYLVGDETDTWPDNSGDITTVDDVLAQGYMNYNYAAYEFNITTLVQKWALGQKNNGVVIKPAEHGKNVSELFFILRNDQSAETQPYLEISYSTSPTPRFDGQ
ncbi:hypothetical protein A2V82_17045 [candidate division KSB1 bacterium RBG_16_48_16]|nr:MAG: hypothetical protein A2V82_17045 [candidate division KSB1 bacterium RBG_16_48_16]